MAVDATCEGYSKFKKDFLHLVGKVLNRHRLKRWKERGAAHDMDEIGSQTLAHMKEDVVLSSKCLVLTVVCI